MNSLLLGIVVTHLVLKNLVTITLFLELLLSLGRESIATIFKEMEEWA